MSKKQVNLRFDEEMFDDLTEHAESLDRSLPNYIKHIMTLDWKKITINGARKENRNEASI